MHCFCWHVWEPVCSRDGGRHQNTRLEGLIVKGHLYVIGHGVGGTYVRDRGSGLNDELEEVSCVYLLSNLVCYLFKCIVLSHPKASQNGKNRYLG